MDKRQNNTVFYSYQDFEINKGLFISYWHQIDEILKTKPKSVLEIGVGSGFVSNYLRDKGINITTFDIDKELNPDVVGNITRLSDYFSENSFEVILCGEVLEHLPFDLFETCLKEIYKVSKKSVVITLPHHALQFYFHLKIPTLFPISFTTRVPFPFRYKQKIGSAHYWEIGWRGYPLKRIKKEMSKYFKIKKAYPVPEKHYHWFFILKVKDK